MNSLICLIYFIISSAFATDAEQTIENNFNIKTGFSLSRVYLKTSLISANDEKEKHTESTAFGFNTSVGYKWNSLELMVGSDILFGTLQNITFAVNSNNINGNGHFRFFTLNPRLRYYTPYNLYNRWNFYVDAGPTRSLHTFILSTTSNGINFNSKNRISFENRGASLNLGFEEIVPFKDTHASFFEIGYSYMRSHRVYIVDATDFKDVKTLQRNNSKDFKGHSFILRFGITLF